MGLRRPFPDRNEQPIERFSVDRICVGGSSAFQRLCNTQTISQMLTNTRSTWPVGVQIDDSDEEHFSHDPWAHGEILNIRSAWQQDRMQFLQKVEEGLSNWRVPASVSAILDEMLGTGIRRIKSQHATNGQGLALLDQVLRSLLRMRRSGRQYYFLTIVDEAWNTLDRETRIDLKSIKNRATHALADCNLDGICFVEFQPITNFPAKGQGRLISPHVHAIVWPENDVNLGCRQVVKKLSGRFSGNFGAPGVKIKRIQSSDADVARVLYYCAKLPSSAKKVNHKRTGQAYLNDIKADYRPDLCLRMAEVLSHFTVRNLCFGRGKGATIVRQAFSILKALERRSPKSHAEYSDPSPIWKRARKENPSLIKYSPVVVRR